MLEIFNPSFTNPCYRMLAAQCGATYQSIYGTALTSEPNAPAESMGDIVIDPEDIKSVFHQI